MTNFNSGAAEDGERTELNVAHLLQHLGSVWNVFLRGGVASLLKGLLDDTYL